MIPIELPNGETVHIRPLTSRELQNVKSVEPSSQAGLMIGFILVDDDGSQAFTRREGESLRHFSWRVMGDIGPDIAAAIVTASSNHAKTLRKQTAAVQAARPRRRFRFW